MASADDVVELKRLFGSTAFKNLPAEIRDWVFDGESYLIEININGEYVEVSLVADARYTF
jgi:hypothetical protein